MAQMTPQKHSLSEFNGGTGNEYGTQILPVDDFTMMAEDSAYAAEMADALTDTPDVSDAGTVGTPTVTLIDNVKNGVTYKKFKFSNLKGAKGDTGATGYGMPTGGTVGQVLKKRSATDYDFEWGASSGSSNFELMGTYMGNSTFNVPIDLANYDYYGIFTVLTSETSYTAEDIGLLYNLVNNNKWTVEKKDGTTSTSDKYINLGQAVALSGTIYVTGSNSFTSAVVIVPNSNAVFASIDVKITHINAVLTRGSCLLTLFRVNRLSLTNDTSTTVPSSGGSSGGGGGSGGGTLY